MISVVGVNIDMIRLNSCQFPSSRQKNKNVVTDTIMKIMFESMKITNRFAISVFPYSEMPYPVHELGTNSRTVITLSNFK